jgi:hypothetical protein
MGRFDRADRTAWRVAGAWRIRRVEDAGHESVDIGGQEEAMCLLGNGNGGLFFQLVLQRVQLVGCDCSDLRHAGIRGQTHQPIRNHPLHCTRQFGMVWVCGRGSERCVGDAPEQSLQAGQTGIEGVLLDHACRALGVEEQTNNEVCGGGARSEGIEHETRLTVE